MSLESSKSSSAFMTGMATLMALNGCQAKNEKQEALERKARAFEKAEFERHKRCSNLQDSEVSQLSAAMLRKLEDIKTPDQMAAYLNSRTADGDILQVREEQPQKVVDCRDLTAQEIQDLRTSIVREKMRQLGLTPGFLFIDNMEGKDDVRFCDATTGDGIDACEDLTVAYLDDFSDTCKKGPKSYGNGHGYEWEQRLEAALEARDNVAHELGRKEVQAWYCSPKKDGYGEFVTGHNTTFDWKVEGKKVEPSRQSKDWSGHLVRLRK